MIPPLLHFFPVIRIFQASMKFRVSIIVELGEVWLFDILRSVVLVVSFPLLMI